MSFGKYLEKSLLPRMEWISVEDELPEYSTEVLAFHKEKRKFFNNRSKMSVVIRCSTHKNGETWKNQLGKQVVVSHWMRLPQKPS